MPYNFCIDTIPVQRHPLLLLTGLGTSHSKTTLHLWASHQADFSF